MHIHSYRARPNGLPDVAYCDTSFVLDLFANAHPAYFNSASETSKTRAADAHGFYIWGRLQGIHFYVSTFTIEEAFQKLLFSAVLPVLEQRGLRGWKELRRIDEGHFSKLLMQGRAAIKVFITFLRGSGLQLLTTRGARNATLAALREERLLTYARALLFKYEADAMDAFHYAFMRGSGIDLAVSSDRDWRGFPYGTLITAA